MSAEKIPVKDLVEDAISVAIQDSIRQGELDIEPKLIASYTAASGSFYLYGEQLTDTLLKDLKASSAIKEALGKVLWNTPMLMVLARVFGGRISLTNALYTSAGSEFIKVGMDEIRKSIASSTEE
jgi:hypothetical protein